MKRIILRGACIGILLALVLGAVFAPVLPPQGNVSAADTGGEFRGVWVASVLSLNYPGAPTTDPAALRHDADAILDNAKALGFNAVFFQVRPASDSLYPSKIFPWSKYLTGSQGLAPADGFDPLAYMISEAHKRGLELHAWINPYRITAEKDSESSLAPGHPALLHPAWAVRYTDGKMYWNPGEPGAQQLIADGVKEIVDNYDVDGIHIDDYFYPGTDFQDDAAFAAFGGGLSLDAWRRANTEATVRTLRDIVRNSGKDMVFGVSPVGIWANDTTSPLGSATKGSEALTKKYADTRAWVKAGLMDYIAPQIYWNIGYEIADYATLVNWWLDVTKDSGVKLYIGQAAYRSGNSDASSPWYGVDEIRRQIEYNRARAGIGGYIMYSYASFMEQPALYALMQEMNGAVGQPAPQVPGAENPPGEADTPPPLPDVPPAAESHSFSDINGHWAAEYIDRLAAQGVINGYADGRFEPDAQISRADFVLMLSRLLGIESRSGLANFSDVPPGAYYADALATAREMGLVSGIGSNIFAPATPVTRQDMFVMAWRALVKNEKLAGASPDSAGVLSAFPDGGAVADYAKEAMATFVASGIVTGGDGGRLLPGRYASRAETAAILARLAVI